MSAKSLPLAVTAGLAQGGDGSRTRAMTGPLLGMNPLLALLTPLLWAAALLLPAFEASAGVVLTTLHSFQVFTNGSLPVAALVQGGDGFFYGTTYSGGTGTNAGTVFKISATGALTRLYSFTGGNDGANPEAALVQGSDGFFYGTTYGGGAYPPDRFGLSPGTVFKISTNGALTTLYSFTGGNDGANPEAGLVQGGDGSFYGTTFSGGTSNSGTVFKIGTDGALATLYSFTGGNDGGEPLAGLVQGSDGNFYGTTSQGPGIYGTVFKISASGALTTLHSFTGLDGNNPHAALVQGSDGNLYGTTEEGGASGIYAQGTVFKISTNGALTRLHSFTGGNGGGNPWAGLVQGSDGSFYGTTISGGTSNYGTVFKINASGALTTLHSFAGHPEGGFPYGGLVQGTDGNLYGTVEASGTNGAGGVFQITTNGALTNLYSFPVGPNDGANPQAGLVQGSDGDFYGTTYYGGSNNVGNVFKISANGAVTSLYSFTHGDDGAYPSAALMQGNDGNFYGTTYGSPSGAKLDGTAFKITPNGALTTLHSFTGGADGANPVAALVQGSDGNIYGAAYYGGGYGLAYGGDGTLFKISTNGALTTLHSFTGGADGLLPSGLLQGSDGNLYGTTGGQGPDNSSGLGTVFKFSASGALTTLYSFTGYNVAAAPNGLVQGRDGNFYGTTSGGGTNDNGTVFQITTNGALTLLYVFTGGNDGAEPQASLVQGVDGNFYGTTYLGGANYNGTVFKVSTNGALTTLYSFTGGADGGTPHFAGLVQGTDGSFYGTTSQGGQFGSGTVFRLTIVPPAPVFQPVTLTNGALNLTWSTEAGGSYQLQYNSDLSSTNWTNLGSPAAAAGTSLSTTVSVTNGPPRFYRAVLMP